MDEIKKHDTALYKPHGIGKPTGNYEIIGLVTHKGRMDLTSKEGKEQLTRVKWVRTIEQVQQWEKNNLQGFSELENIKGGERATHKG